MRADFLMVQQSLAYHNDDAFYAMSECFIATFLPICSRLGIRFEHSSRAMGEEMDWC